MEGAMNHLEPDFPFGQVKPSEAVELPETFPATPANLEGLKVAYDALKEVDRRLTQMIDPMEFGHVPLVLMRDEVRVAILKIEGGVE